jgi:Ca2+-binding RTX toxin-like protein
MSFMSVPGTIEGFDKAKTWWEIYNGLDGADKAIGNGNNIELAKSFSESLLGLANLMNPALGGMPLTEIGSPISMFKNILNMNLSQMQKIAKELQGPPSDSSGNGKAPGAPGLPGRKLSGLEPYGPGPDDPARRSASPPRKDPLVLDMDGDGIETTSMQDGSVILFDHDADGIQTGTGWLKPDDGWVVLDRNNNGNIDNGRELFGADTLKSNGELAKDGFDALADFDSNGDGKVDTNDSVYSDLRIWLDANQDGVSQSAELSTLESHGIVAINVDSEAVQIGLGNGNVQTAIGTFVRADGTEGTVADLTSSASNLDLLVDTYFREFTTHVPLTEQAINSPDLYGSGRVRDLSEAISLSPDLGDWIADYLKQTTRSAQIDRLDGLLERWANTSDLIPLKQQADSLSEKGVKLTYSLEGLAPNTSEYDEFLRKVGVVERFMGFTYGGARGEARIAPLDASSGEISVSLTKAQIDNIELSYSQFKTSAYESLLTRTRLEPYVFEIVKGLKWDSKSAWVDSTSFDKFVDERIAANPRDTAIDLIELVSATGGNLNFISIGWDIEGFLATRLASIPDVEGFSEDLYRWNVHLASAAEHSLDGSVRADLLVGTAGDDTLNGGGGNDLLIAKAGNDWLGGGSGSDTYVFGKESGNDTISESYDAGVNADTVLLEEGIKPEDVTVKRDGTGSDLLLSIAGSSNQLRIESYFYKDGNSPYAVEQIKFADGTVWDIEAVKAKVLEGTPGNDTLVGYAGSDTLDGGAGNDWLDGRGGSDTYVFGKESGNDTISESYDAGVNADTVLLEEGVKPEDVTVKRDGTGSDLLLSIAGSSNQLRIESYFYKDGNSPYAVEQIKFADGTVWDIEAVKAKVLEGTPGNDTLVGYAGSDTLDGGAGNDWLDGRGGSDTYVFGKESGNDTISESYDAGVNADTVLLEEGVKPEDVTVKRDGTGSDLLLSIAGSSNQLRIESYFYKDGNSPYAVEQIKFADGTVWDIEAVKAKVLEGTPGNDTLVGYAGSDTLSGGIGNDILDGGAGNDTLSGDAGNDTYLFGRGYGEDTIYNYDTTAGKTDAIQFAVDIAPSDIKVTRVGDSLVLTLAGTTDSVTVQSYFNADGAGAYKVEEIRFADGTTWNVDVVKALSAGGTSGADTLYGSAGADWLDGLGGNDTLNGDAGNDTLYGGAGNDVLDGGSGNDTLSGDAGNDTYLFGRGSGEDTIYNYDITVGKTDAIQFAVDIAPSDIKVTRVGDSLVLTLAGTTDSVTVQSYFNADGAGAYKVEEIRFADGTTWNVDAVKARAIQGTAGADSLTGYATADTIDGGDGNDTLDGGAGNDTLQGGVGNDTYLFGRGSGVDTVVDFDYAAGNTDVMQFTDLASTDLTALERKGNDLVMKFGANDQLIVGYNFSRGVYSGSDYRIEQFKFSDGVVWDDAAIKARVVSNGDAGNDTITGYNDGGNRIYGLDGNDNLTGGAQADLIDGGEGDDTLRGGEGDDTLTGGSGHDTLYGGDGSDTYLFGVGSGIDRIYDDYFVYDPDNTDVVQFSGLASTDLIALERKGNDLVMKFGTNDQLIVGSNFYSSIQSIHRVEQFKFSDGVVWDDAAIKARVVSNGDAGNDTITGYNDGGNRIYGLDGNDSLTGGARADLIDGGEGDDTLSGGEGDDTLTGGSGHDTLDGGYGSDTYLFGAGSGIDRIYDYDYAYDSGNTDVVQFSDLASTDLTALERKGNDLVMKFGTNDQLIVGSNFYSSTPRVEQFKFSDGVVWDDAAIKARVVSSGDAGNDTITGYNDGGNRIYGLDGNDNLSGGAQADLIDGGTGDDTVSGGAGNDTLTGGTGHDTLYGGDGNDTYLFGAGSEIDNINDYGNNSPGNGDVVLFSGLASTDLTALERKGDDLVMKFVTKDQLIIGSNFRADFGDVNFRVEQFKFSDGVVWDDAAIKARVVSNGDAGNDTIKGYNDGGNRIYGLGGNDSLTGGAQADLIDGGEGDDTLSGGEGDDTLTGGSGHDTLYGGDGNDTYVFRAGSGIDRIYDYGNNSPGNGDVVLFSGLGWTDLTALERKGNDLVMKFGAKDQLIVGSNFRDDFSDVNFRVEQFKFSDGVVWDDAEIKARVVNSGDAGNDTITGYNDGGNRIYGLDGNDSLTGGAQADLIDGGEGDDILYGGGGDDTLTGGSGHDTLHGGDGDDTYLFGAGSEIDTIYDYDSSPGNNDVVLFSGLASTDLTALERKGNDLVMKFGAKDQLIVGSTFAVNFYGGNSRVEQFKFSDGVVWDDAAIKARVVSNGDAGNDTITGYNDGGNRIYGLDGNDGLTGGALADLIDGGEGDDTLSGGEGDDTLTGGSGHDTLYGGDGNDTYLFGAGSEIDTIYDYDSSPGNSDVVLFSGLASTDLTALERKGDDLVMKFDTKDQLIVGSTFAVNVYGGNYRVEQFKFSDGVVWDDAAIKARVISNGDAGNDNITGYNDGGNRIYGLDGNDSLTGGAQADLIDGGEGDDTLSGGEGDDTLTGGSGHDTLYGSDGNDTYLFGAGSELDTIYDYDSSPGNSDVVLFSGLASTDLTALERKGDDLVMKFDTKDQLIVGSTFAVNVYGGNYRVEQFKFIDGVVWDDAAIKARVVSNGDAGNDVITGYNDGGNRIYGLGGNDYLSGGAKADLIDGGEGDDTLSGGEGDDTLTGGSGHDALYGSDGNDTYLFGAGSEIDTIYDYDSSPGNCDVVLFSGLASTDLTALERKGNDLVMKFGANDQLIVESTFAVNLYGGNSRVEQFKFSDGVVWDDAAIKARVVSNGDAGNDTITGYNDGGNRIYGLDGNDNLTGGAQADLLDGGEGNDTLSGGDGNDTLDGGTGNDTLRGDAGNDTYLFGRGSGVDIIADYDTTAGNTDTVQFGDLASTDLTALERKGNDLVMKFGANDQLIVQSNFYSDPYYGGGYRVEQFKFSDGVVWDDAAIKARVISNGDAGNDTITGYNDGGNRIYGLGGNDSLTGGAQADLIDGGEGNDTLSGGDGNDTLDGGAGNDTLRGDAGNDTYLFGRGSGVDTIVDYDYTAGNTDTVQFGDLASTDLTALEWKGDDLVMKFGANDQLIVGYYFSSNFYYGSAYRVEQFKFSDGVVWDDAAIKTRVISNGDAGNDTITGYNDGGNRIYGLGGNDSLTGGAQADLIDGGEGNDTLSGGDGNDTLDGGAGNDTLDGGSGNDTYLFGRGDGQDTVSSSDLSQNKQDVIRFKAGVTASDIQASRQGDSLILTIAGTTDQLAVQNYFWNGGTFNPFGVEAIQFGDGSSAWDSATVRAKLKPTEGNDTLYGDSTDNTISGLGGDDQIYGYGGNDTLDGGTGNDTLDGGAGNDTYLFGRGDGRDTISSYDSTQNKQDVIRFKEGVTASDVQASRQGDSLILSIAGTADQLTVQNYFSNDGGFNPWGIESIQFADGSPAWDYAAVRAKLLVATEGNDSLFGDGTDDALSGLGGNDLIYGNGGNDTLDGGAGFDYLDGGTGNDTYLFGRGDGQDMISSYDLTQNKQDVIRFKDGVAASDVQVSRQGDSLILRIADTQDQLTVQNYFSYDGSFNPYGIESIQFGDGSSAWDSATVKAQLKAMVPTEGNDTLYGDGTDDTISGLGGDDAIAGNGGNDTLDGGTGNDTLDGGDGNDTYLFGRGDGLDMISSYEWNPNKQDAIRFKAGVTASDVQVSRQWDNLILTIAGTTDQLTVQNYFWNGGTFSPFGVESIQFADGSSAWDSATVRAMLTATVPTEGNDTLYGDSTDDTISGLGGDDAIAGNGGNDTLDGGTGNDTLDGGDGNDTYLFGRGDGRDSVSSYEWNPNKQDVIRFKAGVTASDVQVSRQWDNLILTIAGTTDQLTVQNYFWNGGTFNPFGVESIQFTDGSSAWDSATVKAQLTATVPTEGNDTLYGDSTDDTISGLGGDDNIFGNGGNDTLDGGTGNDTLDGGGGNDTYLLGMGFGADILYDGDSTPGNTDTASFLSGIATDQIWFRQVGNNLEASIIGTSDTLTIQNWYFGSPYHVERFQTSDGKTLIDSQVESLVQAMASFAPPASGQTTLPTDYQTALQPVIAANWQ